jgi:hypothetical protein
MRSSYLKKQKLVLDIAIGLILSISFLLSVSAQNRVVTKEEIETVKSNASQKLKKISYISFTSEKTGKNEKKTIYEFVPPNREHFIINDYIISVRSIQSDIRDIMPKYEFKIIPTYGEWIYIGEKVYFRNGAKKQWAEIAPDSIGNSSFGSGTGSGSQKPTITTEYKLTPNQFVRGHDTDLYEVIISIQYSSGKPSIESYKYWINKNGLFAKTQSISIANETIVDYLYDLDLKIEAPIVKRIKRTKR